MSGYPNWTTRVSVARMKLWLTKVKVPSTVENYIGRTFSSWVWRISEETLNSLSTLNFTIALSSSISQWHTSWVMTWHLLSKIELCFFFFCYPVQTGMLFNHLPSRRLRNFADLDRLNATAYRFSFLSSISLSVSLDMHLIMWTSHSYLIVFFFPGIVRTCAFVWKVPTLRETKPPSPQNVTAFSSTW